MVRKRPERHDRPAVIARGLVRRIHIDVAVAIAIDIVAVNIATVAVAVAAAAAVTGTGPAVQKRHVSSRCEEHISPDRRRPLATEHRAAEGDDRVRRLEADDLERLRLFLILFLSFPSSIGIVGPGPGSDVGKVTEQDVGLELGRAGGRRIVVVIGFIVIIIVVVGVVVVIVGIGAGVVVVVPVIIIRIVIVVVAVVILVPVLGRLVVLVSATAGVDTSTGTRSGGGREGRLFRERSLDEAGDFDTAEISYDVKVLERKRRGV